MIVLQCIVFVSWVGVISTALYADLGGYIDERRKQTA